MIQGFVFDCYPDYRKNVMVTWLKTKQGIKKIENRYQPSFYVGGVKYDLDQLQKRLHKHPSVKKVKHVKEKTELGSSQRKDVLAIIPHRLKDIQQLAQQIQQWGRYQKYILYNVDLRLNSRYLQEQNIFFNAMVTWTGNTFICHDDQWSVDYQLPSFSQVTIDLHTKKSARIDQSTQIKTIRIDDMVVETENEVDTLLTTLRLIHKKDPDIIFTKDGDSYLFPLLHHRALKQGIVNALRFGRDNETLQKGKQETSYTSYGRVLYRPAWYVFHGRFHIDTTNSFFYREATFDGLLDVSRCSLLSLQHLSRLGAGTSISQIQVNTAIDQGYLVPWKKQKPEQWKTAKMLLQADRGGLILDPQTGLHENVVELDYASLYPHIMVQENISPETVLCSCCPHSDHRVPQLGYHICEQKIGLIPTVLKPIIDRRFRFKARAKNTAYDTRKYMQLQQAWKWILLVSFGYTGYKNARYGRIECHESITSFSRSILLQAMHLAEQYGYRVLHGIVDSLWVQSHKPLVSPSKLATIISRNTGIRLDVEGRYDWIVFLKSKHHDYGALNRYYGRFINGELKIRGIELRQHSTPTLVKNMQREMLHVFQQATTKKEMKEKIASAVQIVVFFMQCLVEHKVPIHDLLITSRVAKTIDDYKVNTVVNAALKQKQQDGIMVQPGQHITYVVSNTASQLYNEKVCVKERLSSDTSIDVPFYLQYLCRSAETVLLPFGYTEEALLKHFLKKNTCKRRISYGI